MSSDDSCDEISPPAVLRNWIFSEITLNDQSIISQCFEVVDFSDVMKLHPISFLKGRYYYEMDDEDVDLLSLFLNQYGDPDFEILIDSPYFKFANLVEDKISPLMAALLLDRHSFIETAFELYDKEIEEVGGLTSFTTAKGVPLVSFYEAYVQRKMTRRTEALPPEGNDTKRSSKNTESRAVRTNQSKTPGLYCSEGCVDPILYTLLLGTHSSGSSLAKLRNHSGTVLRYMLSFLDLTEWSNELVYPGGIKCNEYWGGSTYLRVRPVAFPSVVLPSSSCSAMSSLLDNDAKIGLSSSTRDLININMMPIFMDKRESIPSEYHGYWPMIQACWHSLATHQYSSFSKKGANSDVLAFLTINESVQGAGETQRRRGLHVECPGMLIQSGSANYIKRLFGGSFVDGGIFMASTLADSCQIYNAQVDVKGIGSLGDVEHLRKALLDRCKDSDNSFNDSGSPARTTMEPNMLYWLTDTTPHEALPQPKSGLRQFFRLVVGPVSEWYSQHNTANPLGIAPAGSTILLQSKFA